MFNLTTGLLVYLCENLRITAKIGSSNGYLKLCCITTNDLTQCFHSSNIAQLGWKRRPTKPSVREDRVQLEKAVCFAALLNFLASN